MAQQLTIDDVLNRAKMVEKTAEEFYRIASQRFEGTEMQMLLVQLAEEEAGHQDDVDDIREKHAKDLVLNDRVEIDGEVKFLDKFEQIAREGTIESVARFALEMEKAAVASYGQLAKSHSGDLRKVFQDLTDFEKTHVDRIERIISDLSLNIDDDWDEFHAH